MYVTRNEGYKEEKTILSALLTLAVRAVRPSRPWTPPGGCFHKLPASQHTEPPRLSTHPYCTSCWKCERTNDWCQLKTLATVLRETGFLLRDAATEVGDYFIGWRYWRWSRVYFLSDMYRSSTFPSSSINRSATLEIRCNSLFAYANQ